MRHRRSVRSGDQAGFEQDTETVRPQIERDSLVVMTLVAVAEGRLEPARQAAARRAIGASMRGTAVVVRSGGRV